MSRRLKRKAGVLTDCLMFILVGLLWLYIWFGTELLQSYY